MSGRFASIALLCLSSALLWPACEEEGKNADIEGRWELVQGFRNQRETGTLAGTYFHFGADGRMITNLPTGPEEQVEYEVSKTRIRQKSTPPTEYTIQSLQDSVMVIGLEMRGMQFELHLRRAEEPPPPPPVEELPAENQDTLPPGNSEL
ncbi:MAG: hypothetical protein IPM98_10865 [Lewinellaceae bacterium]|nr:hypothetical protein [Lewinellaceae bacterium]